MNIFRFITKPIIQAIIESSSAVAGRIEKKLDKIERDQVDFAGYARIRNDALIKAIQENTAVLIQFIRLNEIFVKNMTKYFELELKEMEKRAATPAAEPTEYDKKF